METKDGKDNDRSRRLMEMMPTTYMTLRLKCAEMMIDDSLASSAELASGFVVLYCAIYIVECYYCCLIRYKHTNREYKITYSYRPVGGPPPPR